MTILYLALGMAAVLLAAYPITALALRYAKELEPTQPLEAPPGTAPEPPVAKRPYPSEPERTHLLTVDGVELYKCGKKYIDAKIGSRWFRGSLKDRNGLENNLAAYGHYWHEFPSGKDTDYQTGKRLVSAYGQWEKRQLWAERRKEWQS